MLRCFSYWLSQRLNHENWNRLSQLKGQIKIPRDRTWLFKSKYTFFNLVTVINLFSAWKFSGSTTDSKQFSKQLKKYVVWLENTNSHFCISFLILTRKVYISSSHAWHTYVWVDLYQKPKFMDLVRMIQGLGAVSEASGLRRSARQKHGVRALYTYYILSCLELAHYVPPSSPLHLTPKSRLHFS